MSNDTPALLTGVSFVQEVFAALSLPGASLLGKAVDNALEKRKKAAVDVLIDMIAAGKAEAISFGENDADELVQMLMRFWRAAETGAAKENLELLAKVILGLKRKSLLLFDKFQTYANVLETLSRDEIILIGKVYELVKDNRTADGNAIRMHLDGVFVRDKINSLFAALTRTGLFAPVSAYGGLNYHPTGALYELCELAELHDTAKRSQAARESSKT